MKKLKVLDLSNCFHVKRTPNFSTSANLERLILYRCVSIVEVDGLICHLNRLVSLEARHCLNLQRLPDELGGCLASLEYLSLKNCRSLERLPHTIGNLESLSELNISGTSIKELPDSIGKLKNLKVVKMGESNLSKIPDAFWTIEKLEEIDAHKKYDIEHFHVKIGNCIYRNQSLRILKLKSADIYELPKLPESLIELKLWELNVDTFPDLSNLTNLKILNLSFGVPNDDVKSNALVEDPMPRWIGDFSKLESLALRSPYVTTSPTDLTLPPHLKSLHLRCPNMRRLPRLPSTLSSLCLQFCYSLRSVEDLSNLKKLSTLEIWHGAISEIPGLGCLENLRDLKFWSLGQVEILPDLSKLNKLRRLRVAWCDNLIEIQGELPKSLEVLKIFSCESFQKLPDLSSLNELQMVATNHCGKLNVEAISRLCSEKSIRFLR
ncbi:disease resistance protein RPV1-like [Syzygium oleosum]|uniref:disease resistance protein RPV1-like n=1 Tax=Syzygium oleosum TaxID=219896 RepID=UPI0011D276D6|nr:disease resistance protein RPV1-like [Syzygium oleosum]